MSQSSTEFKLEASFRRRLYFFSALIVFTLFSYIFQLFNLQIVQGEENTSKSERFVKRSEIVPAERGKIFDRNFTTPENSQPLVSNSASLDVILNTSLLKYDPKKIREFIYTFAEALSIPLAYYEKDLTEARLIKRIRTREPFVLLEGISREQQERILVLDNVNRYVYIISSPARTYHMGPALAHVTGYVGKPSQSDIDENRIKSYQSVGKGGLESQYDSVLRGLDGFRIQKRNNEGSIEEERMIDPATPGNNLVLTIDREIQIAAYRALKGTHGTVIALKPGTGEVLALASNPSYDPNILSGKNKQDRATHFARVTNNKGFLNMAIQSKFPPASTFKVLVGLAAMESEHRINFDPKQTFHCAASFTLKSTFKGVPDQVFFNWDKKNHGDLNLAQAIEKSNSVYFYQLGYKLGAEPILSYSKLFGLHQKSGIDLPGEAAGFVPSNDWKQRTFGTKWFDGDTINLSIGQGFISVTPMEMALFYMAIINDGKIFKPYIVSEIRNPLDNSIIQKTSSSILRDIPLKKSTIDALKDGLYLVGYSGTASGVLNTPYLPEIAGKTGTAQTRRRGASSSNHAWFIGYAPYNAPVDKQVLVAVFVEYGVGGAASAAPVAREVFKAAFPPGSFPKPERQKVKTMEEETPVEEEAF